MLEAKDYVTGRSTEGLQSLHKAVRDAFDKDEATPAGEDKPYGVRTYSDWREWSDALEAELAGRGASFVPVPW